MIILNQGEYHAEYDLSNFVMEGKLGRILRGIEFSKFLYSGIDDPGDVYGKSIVDIWQWLTWKLCLRRWTDQTADDLNWLVECLNEVEFARIECIDGEDRWVWEEC